MEKEQGNVASYVTEVANIQKEIKKITREIPEASTERHFELQNQLSKCIERLEEIRQDVEVQMKEREKTEEENKLKQKKDLLKFLEHIFKSKWSYDPKGKIENSAIIERSVADMLAEINMNPRSGGYVDPSRILVDESKFGEVEFITQENQAPDFSLAQPIMIDIMSGQDRMEYEAWKKKHNIGTDRCGDVLNFILASYGQTHYLPGLDYWKWLLENNNSEKTNLFKLNPLTTVLFPGTSYRSHSGLFSVLILEVKEDVFKPYGRRLDSNWSFVCRAVLLPKL